ncbi:MAG: zinc-binding dehydrogenase [Bacteroidota bacterium]
MKAWLLESYGGPEVLRLTELPDPQPREGWILIDIKAFGLNRSELYTRQGHSGPEVTLPRVPGIECVGVVVDGGGTDLQVGQKVAAAMGFMGRKHDGGYAQKTVLPRANVFPIDTDLDWTDFGAIPETYLTAWGVMMEAVGLQTGQTVLLRGGTSSVGMACTSIAKDLGCTVLATTRKEAKRQYMLDAGVDHVIIDHGSVREEVLDIVPEGVHGVVELVGRETTIKDSLLCARPKGCVGLVGFLGNEWGYEFFPWMPSTVKLTMYSSETLTKEYATPVLQKIVDKVAAGAYQSNVFHAFAFEELQVAHRMMEENRAAGKLVIRV